MTNNNVLEMFLSNLGAGKDSFILDVGNKQYVFMSVAEGAGKLFYGIEFWRGNENRGFYYENTNLVALKLDDGTVYLIDKYFFNLWGEHVLPDGIIDFSSAYINIGEEYQRKIQKLIDELEIPEDKHPEYNLDRLKETARDVLLGRSDNQLDILRSHMRSIINDDVIRILLGITSVDKIAAEAVDEKRENIITMKRKFRMINALIENGDLAKPWELELVKALDAAKKLDAKFVTVEFASAGKTASGKIKPYTILDNMDSYFSEYNFQTSVQGKQVMEKLGADNRNKHLRCSDISKILFRGKTLYERKTITK